MHAHFVARAACAGGVGEVGGGAADGEGGVRGVEVCGAVTGVGGDAGHGHCNVAARVGVGGTAAYAVAVTWITAGVGTALVGVDN